MRSPSVDDPYACGATVECTEGRIDLRQHAARGHALVHQAREIASAHELERMAVAVEDAGDVRELSSTAAPSAAATMPAT